jgi:MFS transporter, PPP family, 3-phenylpropionic acid transporter
MEDVKVLGKRLTANYALIQSIYNMSYCCIMSFASVFLLSRGFTNSEVGLTLTIASALAIVGQPIIATFADKTEKITLRSIVAAMFMATTILSFFLLITPSLVLPTTLLYILLVCFHSTQLSLITSMSMEHINNGIPLNFSLARGIGSFAFAILSFFMGFLVDDFGSWIIMPINIGLGLVGISLVSTFQKAKAREVAAGTNREERASGLIEFGQKNKRFIAVVFSIALLFFSHVLINTYTIQIIQNVGGSSSEMGIATAIAGFLELPAMAFFPLIFRRIRNAGAIMKLSGVFLVVKTLITLLAPTVFWVEVAQCLQFFGYAMFIPSSVYYVNEVIDEIDKVKGQTYMAMSLGLSGMIGNALGGLMLDSSGGVSFMLTVGLVVSMVGLIMLVFLDSLRTRREALLRTV